MLYVFVFWEFTVYLYKVNLATKKFLQTAKKGNKGISYQALVLANVKNYKGYLCKY
jgi:hypothetical protein